MPNNLNCKLSLKIFNEVYTSIYSHTLDLASLTLLPIYQKNSLYIMAYYAEGHDLHFDLHRIQTCELHHFDLYFYLWKGCIQFHSSCCVNNSTNLHSHSCNHYYLWNKNDIFRSACNCGMLNCHMNSV